MLVSSTVHLNFIVVVSDFLHLLPRTSGCCFFPFCYSKWIYPPLQSFCKPVQRTACLILLLWFMSQWEWDSTIYNISSWYQEQCICKFDFIEMLEKYWMDMILHSCFQFAPILPIDIVYHTHTQNSIHNRLWYKAAEWKIYKNGVHSLILGKIYKCIRN